MRIHEVSKAEVRTEKAEMIQEMDSESKEFQNQISSAKNQLKELTADNKMSAEEKAKKRQEIQKQITELNNQLRQHQMELRRQQQEKEENDGNMSLEKQRESTNKENLTTEMSHTGMKAMISADSAISRARAQGNVSMEMAGRVRVLQSEIKQDAERGKNTEIKEKELESLERKAIKAQEAKMEILTGTVREIRKAAKEELQGDERSGKEKRNQTEDKVSLVPDFAAKKKTDAYITGKMFSNVEFHF